MGWGRCLGCLQVGRPQAVSSRGHQRMGFSPVSQPAMSVCETWPKRTSYLGDSGPSHLPD